MNRRLFRAPALTALAAAALLSSQASMQERRGARVSVQIVEGREAAAREALVRFRTPEAAAEWLALSDVRLNIDGVEAVGRSGMYRLRSRSMHARRLYEQLSAHPDIAFAEPNYIIRTFAAPDDPEFPRLWGLQNIGQSVNGGAAGTPGADIAATAAWDITTGSSAHVVAILDTGIDPAHPDLQGNLWTAPAPFTVVVGGQPVTCPAGAHGFDAIMRTCDPADDHGHGTHVAGTIGAVGSNGIGVAGVSWTVRLMPIKVFDASGAGTIADAINAIEFARQAREAFAATGEANVRVLSNSWGGREFSQALLDEIVAANADDMLVVAAAGNSGLPNDWFPTYPASYDAPNVVAVAATTNTDDRAWFSNYGVVSVDLGAPGVDIYSTTRGGGYGFSSGTSMAAPHVSGAAALVLSRCSLTTAQLRETLLGSVAPVAALASVTATGGRLDVSRALDACSSPPDAPVLTAAADDGFVTLSWTSAARATSYKVKRGPASGGPYTTVATGVAATSYVDRTVQNGSVYYYVVAATNPAGESAASNEAEARPKAAADLYISAFTAPATAGEGTTISVSVTVANQGAGASDPSVVSFYLSTNYLLDPQDQLLNGSHQVPALATGGSSSASVTLQIPSGTATGLHYLLAVADADAANRESNEANNNAWKLLQVGPDLVVSAFTAPATASAGSTITVSDTVKNQGGGAAAASRTRFYLSANSTLDSGDAPLGAGRAVGSLNPGMSNTGSTALVMPASLGVGTFYLIAQADGDTAVVETQEGNNLALRSIQVGGDLVISALTLPASGGAGAPIVVTDTTLNRGEAAVAASTTRFYLSTNAVLDPSDVLLAGGRSVPSLAAAATSSGSTTVTIPSGTASGTYYLFAKADADNVVPETQEGNNALLRAIGIGSDLLISSLTVPARGGAGAPLVVSETTANQGAGDAGASVTRFYLSTNYLLDAGDVPLPGGRSVPALAAGANSTAQTTTAIPAGTQPGLYYVIARADADNAVTETQEANNNTYKTIHVGPDLTVSVTSLPFSVTAGATVSLTDLVINQGQEAAPATTTRFYLSTNLALDAADVALAAREVPPLGASASSAGSTAITIPAATAPGNYYVIARTDDGGVVAESHETNNLAQRIVQVSAP